MNISILQICLISLFYCFSNISWPFGSMGQWATINRPLVGGRWDAGAVCGSRSANWANGSLYLAAYGGARGASEPMGRNA